MNIPPDVIEKMARAAKAELWVSPNAQLDPIRGTVDAIRAALSVLADGGWVVVPKEPTDAQLQAVADAFRLAWWAADNNCRRDAYMAIFPALPTKDTSHG